MFHGEPPMELLGDDIFPERRGSGPVSRRNIGYF